MSGMDKLFVVFVIFAVIDLTLVATTSICVALMLKALLGRMDIRKLKRLLRGR
jgi:hypothetical protein